LLNLQLNKQSYPKESSSGSQNLSTGHMVGIHLTSSQYVTSANSICCACKLEGKIWIVDSGASDHMVYDKTLLHNITSLEFPILITLPNGNKIKVC